MSESVAPQPFSLSRRTFLAGVGAAGAVALGGELLGASASFATDAATRGTVIVVFQRGGADGLRILVPATSALGLNDLLAQRPDLVPGPGALRPLTGAGGWALNAAMAPLLPYWTSGELAFVPAVSVPGMSRSHFEAQRFLESGGAPTRSDGWLNRVLATLGPATTFTAVAEGGPTPISLGGPQQSLAMNSLSSFTFPGWNGDWLPSETALAALYRTVPGSLGTDVLGALAAVQQASTLRAAGGPHNGAAYPAGNFGSALTDFATLIRGGVGLRVGTLDVGGWDTHTDETQDLDPVLGQTASALAAFLQDLGPLARANVTVVVVTEFGRRVAQNDSGGCDHGHGSVMWLLGGGIKSAGVYGRWQGVASGALDSGDVPGTNNALDVLGEVVSTQLGIGSLATIFPGHSYVPLGFGARTRPLGPQARARRSPRTAWWR